MASGDGLTTGKQGSLTRLLALLGLSGIAITQPVLAVFGDAPEVFVFEEAGSPQIVLFSLVVALVPALVLWALVEVAGLVSRRAGRLAQRAAVGLLVGVLLAQILVAVDAPAIVAGPVALLGGGLVGVGYGRSASARSWAAWLAPAPALFVGLFLFVSPTSALVSEGEVETAEVTLFSDVDLPPVVMLVFDEWPLATIVRSDGTIDAELYPNVAALAGDATWHRDTTTVTNLTTFAIPSLVTGNYPRQGDTADAATHPESLYTLLGGVYDLDVTERITRLCPRSLCEGGPDDRRPGTATVIGSLVSEATAVMGHRLTDSGQGVSTDGFVEDEVVAQARAASEGQNLDEILAPRPESLDRFLSGIEPGESPALHFAHVVAPHTPHRHLPDGHTYPAGRDLRLITHPDGSEGSDVRADVEAAADLDRRRMQLEVAYVDRLLGDVVDHLKDTGLYDEAIIVVTSDHGVAFAPGETARGLGSEPVAAASQPELLWVPLFVKAPNQTVGQVSDSAAETIDVLPTIAELIGIDLPWSVDGRSLLGEPDPDAIRDRRFVRVRGSSLAAFQLDEPVAPAVGVEDVLALGADHALRGTGPDRWYTPALGAELIGQPASALPSTARLVFAAIDGADRFADVDRSDGEIPALISGRVEPEGLADAASVAIVVNGRVAALTPTWTDGEGPGRFAVMVDPAVFVDGPNEVVILGLGG